MDGSARAHQTSFGGAGLTRLFFIQPHSAPPTEKKLVNLTKDISLF